MLGDARDRTDPHGPHRAGQRLGGRGGRSPLDRRREALHLDQRARRVATSLRRLARRRQDAAGDARRVRPPQPGERVRRARYVVGVDSAAGWVYYTASPDNATQLYLYRTRLDGKGKQERVTPRDQPGYHTYKISRRRPVGVPLVLTARHAAGGRPRPPAEPRDGAHAGREPAAPRRRRPAPPRDRGVLQGGRGRRAPARRLDDEAAGLRLDEAVPAAVPTSTASRPARPCSTSGTAATSGTSC